MEEIMRVLIQRVKYAKVEVDQKTVGEIDKGLLLFLGIHQDDTEIQLDYLVKKVIDLRIFEDENGKMNLSLKDVYGDILLVSQFTLYANCDRGRRPDFIQSAPPQKANDLYELFAKKLRENSIKTETGIFGADMKVSLLNDGPVTIMLEK